MSLIKKGIKENLNSNQAINNDTTNQVTRDKLINSLLKVSLNNHKEINKHLTELNHISEEIDK